MASPNAFMLPPNSHGGADALALFSRN